jgi:cytochrome o ubiquinol oxidase operon protein cyoD
MSDKSNIVSKHEPAHGSLLSYSVGFGLSIVLTLVAFGLVEAHHRLSTTTIMTIIVGLALVQFMVQLFFFLHLGRETRPRWKLAVFYFMIGVVLILVLGSLWIMANLNYRMTPDQMNNYLKSQDGL